MVAATAEAARGRARQVPRLHGEEREVEEHRRRTSVHSERDLHAVLSSLWMPISFLPLV